MWELMIPIMWIAEDGIFSTLENEQYLSVTCQSPLSYLLALPGAVAIYFLGVGVDLLYEELKEWMFE